MALIVAELLARAYCGDITTTYDNRSYFALKWKATHVVLNQQRYREREVNGPKAKDVYRIAVVGDSFTFGQGIEEKDRFSNLLEVALHSTAFSHQVEVLNFGNPGANTLEELTRLRRDVLPLQPDFVLLQWYVNDVENNGPVTMQPRERSFATRAKQYLLNTSALYFLITDSVHRIRNWLGQSYAADLVARFSDPASLESKYAENALRDFIRECHNHGVPLGIVLIPQLSPISSPQDYPFLFLHERVLSICQEGGITCLDMLPVFMPYLTDPSKIGNLWVNRFDAHMGSFANHLTAEKILDVFGPVWQSANMAKASS